MYRWGFFTLISFLLGGFLCGTIAAQEVLRGEVMIELEPIYGSIIDENYPLTNEEAYRRALEEGAMFFAASIYGWSFDYDIGERARGIPEFFELSPLGEIPWGDPGLKVTHADFRDRRLWVWMDYHPAESQARRMRVWRSGTVRTAQAMGYSPLEMPVNDPMWLSTRKAALEDAARAAIRAMLQGSERNRPKEARGYISLQRFPIFALDAGRWACTARFYVEIIEIVPFAAY
jgi:hypothetical protein